VGYRITPLRGYGRATVADSADTHAGRVELAQAKVAEDCVWRALGVDGGHGLFSEDEETTSDYFHVI
jgi:hypothetical protein